MVNVKAGIAVVSDSSALDAAHPNPHVLREYALLADGERGILIGPQGDLAWMCFPRWDSPAVFATLIGGHGTYVVTPVKRHVWGGSYESGSLIWRSRWVTEAEVVECREALALPAGPERAVVLRRIEARQAPARVRVLLDLRGDYGRRAVRDVRRDDSGRWRFELDGGLLALWIGAAAAVPESSDGDACPLGLTLELEPGHHHDLVLVLATQPAGLEPPDPERAWLGTEAGWQDRVPELRNVVAGRDARHAYAVLSGLTGAGGGIVAAATTSLPERARQGRSYDYRYVWIRDQCYAGQALASVGPDPLMDHLIGFLRDRLLADGPEMKPVYTVTGAGVPDQERLDLPGYPGGTDIVGNQANRQFQLDAFGESLLLLAAAAGHDHLDADGWRAAEVAADAIARRWQEPDAGIWELGPRIWTQSRLICAAGLRAVSKHTVSAALAGRWCSLADIIIADTAARCVHASGRWQRAADDSRIDASLLLAPVRGAVPADDPRSTATLRAVTEELTKDGFCYRYRPDERPLGEAEGAFLLCGFLMALALGQRGEKVAAARWFERNRAACGPPGLYSEEFDVQQRQLRGNLPQAFVHALLLECAARS
jgi:hypothetical protein